MKVKISCPKCGSNNVDIVANSEGSVPMYKCGQCGYKNNIFPQFGKTEPEDEDEEEVDKDEDDEDMEEGDEE